MPEGPEILSYVLYFRKLFLGKKLEDIISFGTAKKIKLPNENNIVSDINCRGKLLWFELDNNNYIHIHLKITGHYVLEEPEKYLRYKFEFKKDNNLYIEDMRGFVSIKVLNTSKHNDEIDKLGIGLYSNNLTLEYFKELIDKKKKVILCRFLFDQGNIAGIGNYIINEVLYLSKLIPEMKVSELNNNDIKKLYNNILFVGYSNLLSHLKVDNIKIDKKDYEMMPLKKNLEVPYKMKIYGRKETDKGVKIKTKKVCSRKMYYE